MKRRFTKLIAALALLALLIPIGALGQTYRKVTTTPSDWSGTYVIVADASDVIFTGQDGSNNFGGYANVTITGQSVTGDYSNYEVLVEKSGDYYTMKHISSGKYLGWTSGNYLYFSTDVPTSNAYKWTLSTSSILNANDNSRKLQYNSGSPRFACYTSSQKVAYLYLKDSGYTLTSAVTPTGTGTVELSNTSLEAGETATATATANAHYTFTSWSIAGEGATLSSTTDNPTTVTMGTANATITATFTEDPKYNITYNPNYEGSTDEPVVVSDYAGATMTIAPYNTFSRTGYAITSWNTQTDGTGTSYNAGDSYTMTSTGLTLYAQWEVSYETVDVLDLEFTGIAGGSGYGNWSGKEGTSGAVYAGNSGGGSSTSNPSIQLRTNGSNSGIVSTTSGGKVTKVEVTWNSSTSSGRKLDIYGKNSAYSAATDLYGDNAGTLIGSITCGNNNPTVLTISGNYEYIGMRSNSGAMYLDEIKITWSTAPSTDPSITAENVNITYNAEEGNIAYQIENSVEGASIQALLADGATITNFVLGEPANGAVHFTCDANATNAIKTATVTLNYVSGDATLATKDVTVTQAGNPNVFDNISSITEVGTTYSVKGTVVATNDRGFVMGDGTGYVYFYKGSTVSQSVGNMITFEGTTGTYGHIIQFVNNPQPIISEATSSNYNGTPAATVITSVPDYAEGLHLSTYLEFEGALAKSNNNYLITLGESQIQISYPTTAQGTVMTALDGKTVHVKGYFSGINSSNKFTVMLESIEEVAVPTITLLPDPDSPSYTQDGYHLEFAYYSHGGGIVIVQPENFQGELTYEDFHIQYCDANGQPIEGTPDWLLGDGAKVELLGDVLYLNVAVKYNNTGTERSCYFKVWAYNGTTEVYSDLVTVHQADKPVINANDIVLTHDATSGSIAYTISNPIANTSLTATLQEGIDWISDINVGETAVTFNTTVNTGAIRTATITLTYKDTDNYTHATKVVTVTQILHSETGTITFGSGEGSTNINGASVTGKDNLGNTWTISTTGTNSFTPNPNYAQVGSSSNPAETITFTTSLGEGTTIASIEAKFGGNTNTAGDINLFVDNTNVGVGALNGTADVIVQSTTIKEGNAITVTVSHIAKGVKCYYISYSYVASTAPSINADEALPLVYDATSGSIHYTIGNPVEGGVLTASINEGSTIADLVIGTITDEAVPFTCSANTATTQHTATITLTYKNGDEVLATKEVTLTQDRVPMQNVTMAFHPTAAMATIGVEAFTAPELTINPAGLTVTYSSSNTDVATVNENTGEVTITGTSAGITEITATFAGNDAYFPASTLYTLFVNDNPNTPVLTVDEANITQTTAPVLWTPCASVNTYTLDLAPVAISESFEGNVIPDGWTNNGVFIASGKDGDGTYCIGFNGQNDNLITPALNNPKAISFMYKRSSNTAAWSLEISYATSLDSETWTTIGTVSDASTDWQTFSASLNVMGPVYIKFKDTRDSGASERYIDLVQIAGEYTSQSVTATSYTFENLAAGATYYARVKGNEDYSNVVSFTTLPFTKEIAGYGNSEKDGYYLIASPVGEVTPTAANGFLTSDYDLYVFDESQNGAEWRNYEVMTEGDNPQHANFSTLEPGKGYLYASQTTTTIEFTGTPYVGDGTFTLSKTDNVQLSGWNLVGNPYATIASIDKTDFYVMNEAGNEIVTSENNTIAAMQGVFVHADEAGETVTFTPGNTDAVNQSITAQVSQNRGSVIDRVRVRFGEGRQLPKFMLNSDNTKLYIPQGNKDYAVVRSANEGEMPVSFKAETRGTYTLSVNTENVEMSYLHLIDNMTGADVDLLATPSYTFEATPTDYASRFRLVFSTNSISEDADGDNAFAYYNGSSWTVSNMGEATLQVVDVMGRVLSSETLSGNAEVSINQTPGVYMLRLVSGNSVKVQKVVVR